MKEGDEVLITATHPPNLKQWTWVQGQRGTIVSTRKGGSGRMIYAVKLEEDVLDFYANEIEPLDGCHKMTDPDFTLEELEKAAELIGEH